MTIFTLTLNSLIVFGTLRFALLEFYKKAFEGLKTTVEQNLHTAELQTTERNYVWEAALAAMQVL